MNNHTFLRHRAVFIAATTFLLWLVLSFALMLSIHAQTVLTPTVTNVTTTGFTVSWTTAQPLDTEVHYSVNGGVGQSFVDATLVTNHTATISGLAPGGVVSMTVQSTAPAPPNITSAAMTVNLSAPVLALVVSPATVSAEINTPTQLDAAYSDGSQPKLVTWTVTGGASVSSTGLFTATMPGIYTVTAVADNGQHATAVVTVTAPPVNVNLVLSNASAVVGQNVNLHAVYSDGSTPKSVTWATSDPAHSAITADGVFSATAAGTYTVTVTSNTGSVASAVITVAAPTSLNITPANPSVVAGTNQQFTAQASDGSTVAITWTATGGTISSTGVFVATNSGNASVTASSGTMSTTVSFEVAAPPPPPPVIGNTAYGTPNCPGCFFAAPSAQWILGPAAPGIALENVTFGGQSWSVPQVWGTGEDVSNKITGAVSLNTHNGYYGNPIEHYNSSTMGNGKTWYFKGADTGNTISVTLPNGFKFTPSCDWSPSGYRTPPCYGAFDGHLVIIDDATGNFYFFGQLVTDSTGTQPEYCTGSPYSNCQPTACGASSGAACPIRSVGTGNLATTDPTNCTPYHNCGDSNTGTNNAQGDIIPSGTPTGTGTPVQQGELDCFTCLNHGISFAFNDNSTSACNAFPVPIYTIQGWHPDGNDSNGILGEGGVIFFTGDWKSWENDGKHSVAAVAIARALQLYGGYDTDSTGGNGIGIYTDYPTQPSITGLNDVLKNLVFFKGTSKCTP